MNGIMEWIVMIFAFIFIVILAYRWLYRFLHTPATITRVRLGKGSKVKDNDPNVILLREKGYVVLSSRHLIPIVIELDGEVFEKTSNLYVDYVAEKNGKMYIVRYERERRPVEWTASGIRDGLLQYALLLPEMFGILYINHKEGILRKINFHLLDE